jgi:hypothetical protein
MVLLLLHGILLILVDLACLLVDGQVVQGAGARHVRLLVELWVCRFVLAVVVQLSKLLLGLLLLQVLLLLLLLMLRLVLEYLVLLHSEHVM